MTYKQNHNYFFLSCLFHALCCGVALVYIFYAQSLIKKNNFKQEAVIDVSFVSDERINKPLLRKITPQSKIPQKIIAKPVAIPIQKIVQKPVPVVKKIIAIKPPQAIPPVVKIADMHQKPLSQIKQTVDKHAKNHKTSNNTNTHKTVSVSQKVPNPVQKALPFNQNDYIAYVKQRIAENKFYPNTAKRRAIEGRVGLKISIKPTGDIASLHIINSSGSDILDKAAMQSVRQALPFKATPQSVGFSFGINYYLE